MPPTIFHWLVLVFGVSIGQFALKILFTWLASLDFPGAHKLGTSVAAIIP